MARSSKPAAMKIQHITYEESRGGRSPTMPSSATKKVKDYFSRLSHSLDHGAITPGEKRPTTMWPRMDIAPSDDLPEMAQYLTQKRRAERAAMKKEAGVSKSANSSADRIPSVPKKGEEEQVKTETRPPPPLRRKPNFKTIVKNGFQPEKAAEEKRSESTKVRFLQGQDLRLAIQQGKIEKVIPPTLNSTNTTLHAPPRPTRSPSLDPTPPKPSSSSSLTSKTNSLVENLRTSADILDERRREITGKFRPPFEHLNYPSFSLSHRSSKLYASSSSTSSEASFGCIGEDDHSDEELLTSRYEGARRLSGEGVSPWVGNGLRECRLCEKTGVNGLRGLCGECEREFMRRKPASVDDHRTSWTSSVYSDDEELKPTPPLKDRDAILGKKVGEGKFAIEKELPPVPVDEESDEEEFDRWQKEELEKAEKVFGRWSNDYANKDQFEDEEDHMPLIFERESR